MSATPIDETTLWEGFPKPHFHVYIPNRDKLTKEFEEISGWCPGRVRIKLKGATNVAAKDRGGTSDPYAVCYFVDGKGDELSEPARLKTEVVKKTLNPVWDAEFEFEVTKETPHRGLIVDVFDKDFLSDDVLGGVQIDLVKEVQPVAKVKGHKKEMSYTLKENSAGKGKKISGEVNFEFFYEAPEIEEKRAKVEELDNIFEKRDKELQEEKKAYEPRQKARIEAFKAALEVDPKIGSLEMTVLYGSFFSGVEKIQIDIDIGDVVKARIGELIEQELEAFDEEHREIVRQRLKQYKETDKKWIDIWTYCEAGGDMTLVIKTACLLHDAVQAAGLYDLEKQERFGMMTRDLFEKRNRFSGSNAHVDPGTEEMVKEYLEKAKEFLESADEDKLRKAASTPERLLDMANQHKFSLVKIALDKGFVQPTAVHSSGHSLAHIAVLWCKDVQLAHELTELTPPALWLDGVNEMSGLHEGAYKELLRVAGSNNREADVRLGRYKITRERLARFYGAVQENDSREVKCILKDYEIWANSNLPTGKLKHPDGKTVFEMEGRPPMLVAIFNGSLNVCRALLAAGAGVDDYGKDGFTAPTVAVLSDNVEALEWVLKQKPKVDLFHVKAEGGMSAVEVGEIVAKAAEVGLTGVKMAGLKSSYKNGERLHELLGEYLKAHE